MTAQFFLQMRYQNTLLFLMSKFFSSDEWTGSTSIYGVTKTLGAQNSRVRDLVVPHVVSRDRFSCVSP